MYLRYSQVRRGYWGNKIGKPHTIYTKVTGKCGSVSIRLVPAPKGAGIVAARTPKKVLQMAGISDVYTSSTGSTKTLGVYLSNLHLSHNRLRTATIKRKASVHVCSIQLQLSACP